MNPGATGLFDSFRFVAGGYDRVPSDAQALRHGRLHEVLSEHGKRVGLLNVPLTVPLHPVNGFVVSGDEGVGEEFAYPAEVRDALAADGYVVSFRGVLRHGTRARVRRPRPRRSGDAAAGGAQALRRWPLAVRHAHASSVR